MSKNLSTCYTNNPYTDKDTPRDKQSILDIRAKTTEGELINVEMQLFNKYDTEKRTMFYWSKSETGVFEQCRNWGALLRTAVTVTRGESSHLRAVTRKIDTKRCPSYGSLFI